MPSKVKRVEPEPCVYCGCDPDIILVEDDKIRGRKYWRLACPTGHKKTHVHIGYSNTVGYWNSSNKYYRKKLEENAHAVQEANDSPITAVF